MASSSAALAGLAAIKAEVDAALAALDLPAEPASLYDPVRYALAGGGKRVRAALVRLAAQAFGGPDAARRARPAALAVEVFHTFTLVHDDLMDGSATRRGRASVHVRYDDATAILAGDLLMGLAYRLIDRSELDRPAELRTRFHAMVARLCEGQALDMAFETRADVTPDDYLRMIDGKTGALLELALEAGALVGGADAAAVEALGCAGRDAGRAFQIQDDLLDLTATDPGWGKPLGQDLVEGKRTALLLGALARSSSPEAEPDDTAFFHGVLGGLDPAQVDEARDRMRRLGVLDAAARDVEAHARASAEALAVLPDTPAADALRRLVLGLAGRST